MKQVSDIVRLGPVIPVLAFESAEQGENVSRALHAGGVKVLEITLRTAAGLEAIERASHLADDIVVGVGTITRPEHCGQAKKAGAQFGVSPGLTKDIHQAALDCGLPLLPGVMTPTDIIVAMELGYEIVKLFPAQQAGGGGDVAGAQRSVPHAAVLPDRRNHGGNRAEFSGAAERGVCWRIVADAQSRARGPELGRSDAPCPRGEYAGAAAALSRPAARHASQKRYA